MNFSGITILIEKFFLRLTSLLQGRKGVVYYNQVLSMLFGKTLLDFFLCFDKKYIFPHKSYLNYDVTVMSISNQL